MASGRCKEGGTVTSEIRANRRTCAELCQRLAGLLEMRGWVIQEGFVRGAQGTAFNLAGWDAYPGDLREGAEGHVRRHGGSSDLVSLIDAIREMGF